MELDDAGGDEELHGEDAANEVGDVFRAEWPRCCRTSSLTLPDQIFGELEEESTDEDFAMYQSVADHDIFALHRAARDGDLERLQMHMDRMGVDPNRRDSDHWGATPLHSAVLSSSLPCFIALLDWEGTRLSALLQDSPLPHVIVSVACISSNFEFGLAALKALVDRNHVALLTESKDEYDRTPLRLACELGCEIDIIKVLIQAIEMIPEEEEKRKVVSSTDRIKKWNILHCTAALSNVNRREEILAELLSKEDFGNIANAADARGRTCLHIVVRTSGVFSESDFSCSLLLNANVDQEVKDDLGRCAADYARNVQVSTTRQRRGKTIVFSHQACSMHYTAPPRDTEQPQFTKRDIPPENVNRLTVLLNERLGTLNARRISDLVEYEKDPQPAQLGDVLRVHEWAYVSNFKNKCDNLPDDMLDEFDSDTTFSKMTYLASLVACGATISAVDEVMAGRSENAFCAVRPPGHHAGPSGIVPDCTSHGFCFLNTVAVGAAYALDRFRDQIKKVAIIDFDVHHGNGTEVCVENLTPSQVKSKTSLSLPFGGDIVLSRPTWKPWLGAQDRDNVLFASVHGFGKAIPGLDPDPTKPPLLPTFYPGSGKSRGWQQANIVDYGQNSSSRMEWRYSWMNIVLPRLREFQPDFMFISAGFDAHFKDAINGGFCGATEHDYEWITQQLVAIANECCEGRIVSVLEGGYKIQGGCVSYFARSVAEHVRVLAEADPNVIIDDTEQDYEKQQAKQASTEHPRIQLLSRMLPHLCFGDGHPHETDQEPVSEEDIKGEPLPAEESFGDLNGDGRPRRRTTSNIDFVQLNQEMDREREAKRARNMDA